MEENAPASTSRRISNAARRAGLTGLGFAKTIANLQLFAGQKLAPTHTLSRFRLKLEQTQRSTVATLHDQIVSVCGDYLAGFCLGICRSERSEERRVGKEK